LTRAETEQVLVLLFEQARVRAGQQIYIDSHAP
jgi:hypothetical protein